jgi:alkylglycerol monooxygenase
MEEYGRILLIAMPIFLLAVVLEKVYGLYKKNDTMPLVDTISSLSSGMSNVVKDVLGLSISIFSYEWLVERIAIFEMKENWLMYIYAFIVIDFYGYWSHRFDHKINFFWNEHIVHHSSEEFNLACALRQPVSGIVRFFGFLLIPAALFGIPPIVIATILPLHLFMQFWYHTRHIKRMGFLEKILVTPSHHRVHHAMNPEYLDKNLSQIFIFWDKLFGTFQEEKEDIIPVYGVTRPSSTWNPFKINFQHLWLLVKDAWRSPNWKDKLTIWFKPTGWRPAGFEEMYPVNKIENVYHFQKYKTNVDGGLLYWSIFQLFATLAFISHLFYNIGSIGMPAIFYYGFFIFATIYVFTDLMDRNKLNWVVECLRIALALVSVYLFDSWFSAPTWGLYIVFIYLGISLIVSWYYSKEDISNFSTNNKLSYE